MSNQLAGLRQLIAIAAAEYTEEDKRALLSEIELIEKDIRLSLEQTPGKHVETETGEL